MLHPRHSAASEVSDGGSWWRWRRDGTPADPSTPKGASTPKPRLTGVAIALLAMLVAGCGPGPDHYVGVLDELTIPPDWELVYLMVNAPGGPDVSADPGLPRKLTDCAIGDCPAVARFYLVSDEPIDLFPTARQILVEAGFEIGREFDTGCDRPGSGLSCGLTGAKDGDEVRVSISHPGEDPAGVGLADPSRSMVQLLAEKE